MNLDEIKKKIRIALDVVKEIEDSEYRFESYKIILNFLMNEGSSTSKPEPKLKNSTRNEDGDDRPQIDIEENIKVLAKNCQLNVEEFKDVINIEKDKIQLLIRFNGNEAKQLVSGSLCILIANEIILENEWMSALHLSDILKSTGIPDKGSNLSTRLKNKPDLFRSTGKGPGKKYKLTSGKGTNEAYLTIKKLGKGS